jgi:hypothetical protein
VILPIEKKNSITPTGHQTLQMVILNFLSYNYSIVDKKASMKMTRKEKAQK